MSDSNAYIRKRIRQIVAEKAKGTYLQSPLPAHLLREQEEKERAINGGFFPALLPLLSTLAPIVAPAIGSLVSKITGNGKHRADAKTRQPNEHAMMVRQLIADAKSKGQKLSVPQASKMASEMRKSGMKPKPAKKARKSMKEY